jgi:hypothetical protein
VTSREKVRAAIDRAESFADDPSAPGEVRAAAGAFSMFRGLIERQLPESDEELDALLEKGARWMWSLRSDDD